MSVEPGAYTPNQEAIRPEVRFETRAIEDRTKTIEGGKYLTKDVEFAVIRQIGGKDTVEKECTDELIRRFQAEYDAWKRNQEPPIDGSPIREWPAISPSQKENCQRIGIRSIEQLAAASESALEMLGQGSRALREKAKNWLATANDTGKVAEEISALKVRMDDVESENVKLKEQAAKDSELIAKMKEKLKEADLAIPRRKNVPADDDKQGS